ncbi:hypothetical protein KR093_009987, partial [Drosophila rubida]
SPTALLATSSPPPGCNADNMSPASTTSSSTSTTTTAEAVSVVELVPFNLDDGRTKGDDE